MVKPLLQVVGAVARNRALAAVMVAYGVFSATQNAVWIAMLVYAYDRGGAGTAGAVAIAQLLPAALLAPVAAAVADLVAAIRRFCEAWNERCQPFVWVKDADEIRVKATRKRTSGTEH